MREQHPYGTFIPEGCRAMIIGTFPIGKFSNPLRKNEIKNHEIDFFFGGEKNLLWKLLGDTFGKKLDTREKIIGFLKQKKLGVGDVISSCVRRNGGGADSDLKDIEWNHSLLKTLEDNKIKKIFFTGRHVERCFLRLFKDPGIEMVTLISPSAQSARSIVKRPDYMVWRKINPARAIYEFILEDYKSVFNER